MKLFCACLLTLVCTCGPVSSVRAELVNGIRAVVHTSVITRAEVESDVLLLADEYRRLYGRQPEVFNQKIEAAFKESLDQSIERQLILRDFISAGYNLPESVIDEVVQREIKASFGDRATLTKTLQARGITYEKWRQQARERFLVNQLRLKNIYQETVISPYKIENYYNEHKTAYQVEDQVKLRMITLNKGDEDETEAARGLAQEILTKLKAGAAFSEMATIYSQGAQRSQGGDWGWAERKTLRSELADVAFKLKPGELSEVVETPQALFIMLVEDQRISHSRPIAEVREEIEQALLKLERDRLQKKYVEKLRKKTFVRQFEF
jgi:peptidyl-prolyl cis-trans isomerase SurA